MLFNSYIFVFAFLPAVLVGWWRIRATAARLIFLTLSSYVFYAWWNWRFLPLMIASTTVDYVAGQKIANSTNPRTRKLWLIASMSFNLAILGFFKYFGFFATTVNSAAARVVPGVAVPVINVILPIGISFYTFNSMSYTIDIYRGVVRPAKSVLHFSAFVAMFPHLVAGPIVRYSDIEHQFNDLKTVLPWHQAATGICFFVAGMAKKIFIADRLAGPANTFFGNPAGGVVGAWIGVLAYTFQIYFDFSAYSDMAVGLAHMLGIQFPQNFNSPYKAANISDFWRRWHMSLSFWLRDYLFISMGGSRKGTWKTARNLGITMFLGGLWHGANWTFVIWGLYHGVLLAIYHIFHGTRKPSSGSPIMGRGLTFLAVVVGWVFFKADTLGRAGHIIAMMAGVSGLGALYVPAQSLVVLAVAALIAFLAPNTWEIQWEPKPLYAYVIAIVLVAAILFLGIESPFLYFQF
jgi:alginate O-acetyltransferase complex protein AlgI